MNNLDLLLQQINILSSELLYNNSYIEGITFSQYIQDYYIPFQKNAKNDKNFRDIIGKLKIISNYNFTKKIISFITENDILNFFNLLKKDRHITQATQNRYRSLLNHIFNSAIRDKLILTNPVKYIHKYKEISRNRALNNNEIKLLLESCKQSKNKELYYIVLVALYTGMRYSNIINMRKSKLENNTYLLEDTETKSGKQQIIHLSSDLLYELKEFMHIYDNGEYIFKSKIIKRSFNTACRKAYIKNFRFHDLRRTFATTLLDNNVNIKVIQHMLGHSSIVMTEKYLAHNSKKELDAVSKLCFISRSESKK